jgi:hypothetical protein
MTARILISVVGGFGEDAGQLTLAPSSTTKAVWNTRRLSRPGISCDTRLTTEPPKL